MPYRFLKRTFNTRRTPGGFLVAVCLFPLFVAQTQVSQAEEEARTLRIIVVSTETDALELRQLIRSGESFDTLARQRSLDASAESGGYIGRVKLADLREDYREALSSSPSNTVSPVVKDGRQFALLQWLTPEEEQWRTEDDAAFDALRLGQYPAASEHFLNAIRIAEGFRHKDYRLARSLYALGQLYMQQGLVRDAQHLYERSLPILEDVFGSDNSEIASNLNNLAETYRLTGDNARAEPLYRRSLDILERTLGTQDPKVGTSLNNLALILQGLGQMREAESLLKRAVQIEESRGVTSAELVTYLVNLAAVCSENGNYGEAASLYERSLRISEGFLAPDNPNVLQIRRRLAETDTKLKRYGAAETLYESLLARVWSANAEALKAQAALDSFARVLNLAFFRDDALAAAIEDLLKNLQENPPDERIYSAMSHDLHGVELDRPAEQISLQAVENFPNSRNARFEAGRMYLELNRFSEALEAFELAARMENPAADATADKAERYVIQHNIGYANARLYKFPDAIAAYSLAAQTLPEKVEALVDLGDLFLNQERINEAFKAYSDVKTKDPQNVAALYGLAEVNLRRGHFKEAAGNAAAALASDSRHSKARYVRGRALMRSGKRQEGQKELELYSELEAAALDKRNAERDIAVLNRTAADLFQESPDDAIVMFREGIRNHPDAIVLQMNLALAQSKLGRHEDAIETLKGMIAGGSGDDFLVHLNLSNEYKALGDSAAAAEHRLLYLKYYETALNQRLSPQ